MQVCTAPMLRKSEKILMSLNTIANRSHFVNWQTQNSYPKETKNKVTLRK